MKFGRVVDHPHMDLWIDLFKLTDDLPVQRLLLRQGLDGLVRDLDAIVWRLRTATQQQEENQHLSHRNACFTFQ